VWLRFDAKTIAGAVFRRDPQQAMVRNSIKIAGIIGFAGAILLNFSKTIDHAGWCDYFSPRLQQSMQLTIK
ncbi:MAG: hypothetical protein ABL893_17635, partial [Hyphomicrobium sp.]